MIKKLTPYFDALRQQGVVDIPTLGIPLILSITTLGKLYNLDSSYLRTFKSEVLASLTSIDNMRLGRTRYDDNLLATQLNEINQKMGSFVEQIRSQSSIGDDINIIERGIKAELAKVAEDAMRQPRQTVSMSPGPRSRL